MNDKTRTGESGEQSLRAEFDLLADEYHGQHKANVAITGEGPEYFAEYKIVDLANLVRTEDLVPGYLFDFGCGIGNSVPYFRKYFPDLKLSCGDVSSRSIEIAKTRNSGDEDYVIIGADIPLPTHSQDIVFSACVFHHIPHEQHQHWLAELLRVTRPGGLLAIYEHNPWNPLTVRAVNTCPLDVNARLIRGSIMRKRAVDAGWVDAKVGYKLFFPAALAALRPIECHLEWLALGAQYRMTARR